MVTSSRHVGVGDQHARAALHAHHGLEHVYRVGDHRAVQYVLDGDRLAVEHRAGVGTRIGPLVYRDPRQSRGVITVFVPIALGDLRVRAVLADVAIRDLEFGLR